MENTIVKKVAVFATNIIANKIPDTAIYHNISYTHRLVSAVEEIAKKENLLEQETEQLLIAAWLFVIGYTDDKSIKKNTICLDCIITETKPFFESINYSQEEMDKVYNILSNFKKLVVPTKSDAVFSDAVFMEYAKDKGKKYINKMYQELLVFNAIKVSKKKWYEELILTLEKHTYATDYGKTTLEAKKHSLIRSLKKEIKALESIQNAALKKELDISDSELKELKKNIGKSSKTDLRAVQTLFRNTSRNHYTLSTMVDRKANIMISINAIINSLIIGGLINTVKMPDPKLIPIFILMVASLISIFYAILAIRPDKTHGEFTEEEIRNKQGNLLYFGNFHNMGFRDYEWAMLEMLTDKDYLYSSLIKDIYYLGEKLQKKHTYIRKSLTLFLIGTGLSGISFLILKLFL